MFIHEICKTLQEAGVAYAVVGGYAVAMHGALRATFDIDIAINWTFQNLQKAEQALKKHGLISLIPITSENLFHFREEYIQNRNLIAWNFYDPIHPVNQVDIIINYDLRDATTKTFKTPSGDIKILSLDDLIKMKIKSGRPQDLEDVKALEKL